MDTRQWLEAQRSLRAAIRDRRRQPSDRKLGAVKPLVSVIVPVRNAQKVIDRCLQHLLAQDYPTYEVIVVDDGSEDETVQVAEAARDRDELTIVRSRRNRGCPHARNLGLRHARGEVVAFIDADGFAAPDWLSRLVRAFDEDPTIGGVASTVFYDTNPLVINGAGGTVNRQGWAADLSMNECYEHARIASEVLYPMGCGMALRRSAIERVGPFDDRMLNYYDDVDYGIRLWRAGYRVAVAADAWIDHGFDGGANVSSEKRRLYERHRIRTVLKHAPPRTLASWARREARPLGARQPRRAVSKARALAWNLLHLPSLLLARRRLRGASRPPEHLIDPSWGDGFPAGLAPVLTPRPEKAGSSAEMATADSDSQLIFGWFPAERVGGRRCRWAAAAAALLVTLDEPARGLRLDYSHVPVDSGGFDVRIGRLDAGDPLAAAWTTHVRWQYSERAIENHPLDLPAGHYEVRFTGRKPWSDPPHEMRQLSFALASISFTSSRELPQGGVEMSSPASEAQLVYGWYEREQQAGHDFRWADASAAVMVRLAGNADGLQVSFRMPPSRTGGFEVSLRPVGSDVTCWSGRIASGDDGWRTEKIPLNVKGGDYVMTFRPDATWSNPKGAEPTLPPENRTLGIALSSLRFNMARD